MCKRAVEVAERVRQRDRSNATFQELLAGLYTATGEIAAEGGKTAAAIGWLEKSRAAYGYMRAAGTLSSGGAAQLAKVEAELAQLSRKPARQKNAVLDERTCHTPIYETDPSSGQVQPMNWTKAITSPR
jgi:hypothetical protein